MFLSESSAFFILFFFFFGAVIWLLFDLVSVLLEVVTRATHISQRLAGRKVDNLPNFQLG